MSRFSQLHCNLFEVLILIRWSAKDCFLFIIHLPLSTDAVSTPSLHPLVNAPPTSPGVQCTLITTDNCLLKGEPEKSLSLIIPNHTPNSNNLTNPLLIGLVETQYSAREKGTAGGSKAVVITLFDSRVIIIYNHPPSWQYPLSGIWDCRFVFIRSDVLIDRQG